MLSYRSHIYTLAMEASGAAIDLGLSLANCVVFSGSTDLEAELLEALPTIERQAAELENAVGVLLTSLPDEVTESVRRSNQGLLRHLYWINRRVGERLPDALCRRRQ